MRMRFGFRSPSKDNVSSPCSIEKLLRAPFLIHYALNNDERATHSRFPLTNAMWRVRGRLTLMLAAAANATATPAPARHLWLVRTSPSACLSLPRARGGRRRLSNGFRAFQPSSNVTISGAGSGGKPSSLTLLDKQRFVRHPAGSHRASLPQAQHRLSRCLLSAGWLPLRSGKGNVSVTNLAGCP
jgi:hypothetical protein